MRIGLLPFAFGVVLSGCASATSQLTADFNGDWDVTTAACADPNGLTRLGIKDDKLQFYEWGGDIVSVRRDGRSVEVDLDWWDINDADANDRPIPRRRTGTLTLSSDRSSLQIAIEDDTTSYVRCPGAPQ